VSQVNGILVSLYFFKIRFNIILPYMTRSSYIHTYVRTYVCKDVRRYSYVRVCEYVRVFVSTRFMYECMYVRVYVCIYLCISVCMYVYIHICMHICIYAHVCTCMYIYLNIYKISTYIYGYRCIYYVYICIYVCTFVCVCVYMKTPSYT